jgi:hypothetical protein
MGWGHGELGLTNPERFRWLAPASRVVCVCVGASLRPGFYILPRAHLVLRQLQDAC